MSGELVQLSFEENEVYDRLLSKVYDVVEGRKAMTLRDAGKIMELARAYAQCSWKLGAFMGENQAISRKMSGASEGEGGQSNGKARD